MSKKMDMEEAMGLSKVKIKIPIFAIAIVIAIACAVGHYRNAEAGVLTGVGLALYLLIAI